jgi:adenosine deaminase
LHRAGFAVTVNTDNRLMSRTSVSAEFDLLRRFHGFTDHDVAMVTRRALRAAFCPWSLKQHLWEERIRPAYLTAGVPVSSWE